MGGVSAHDSSLVGVSDLEFVEVLLFVLPLQLSLFLLKGEALVLSLNLLELSSAFGRHLVLEHAPHPGHGQGLVSVRFLLLGLLSGLLVFLLLLLEHPLSLLLSLLSLAIGKRYKNTTVGSS